MIHPEKDSLFFHTPSKYHQIPRKTLVKVLKVLNSWGKKQHFFEATARVKENIVAARHFLQMARRGAEEAPPVGNSVV